MISKELLSEVLKEDLSSNKIEFEQADGVDSSIIVIDNWLTINIYELAHKCKEWAINDDYIIQSEYEGIKDNNPYSIIRVYKNGDMVWDNYSYDYAYYDELTGIFKACEWIMENKCGS